MKRRYLVAVPLLLPACAVHDSRVAEHARHRLLGISEVEAETCLGVPDQHATFGTTDVLTYYTASSSNVSYQIPLIEGPSLSNGGNCHMTIRFDRGTATRILYSGEKNALGSPSAFCAPIVRTCMGELDRLAAEHGSVEPPAVRPPS